MTKIVATIAFVLLWSGMASARGPWFKFNPPEAVNGQGILQEVVSRCDANGRQTGYDPDLVTYAHEATHQLNSRIRCSVGGRVNAIFVGNGKGSCAVLAEPHVTLSTVAQYVNPQLRDSTFQLYFVDQAASWNDCPLYVLDEFSAYVNGSQAAKEFRVDNHGEYKQAIQFCHFADCLVKAVQENDPSYPQIKELAEVVEFQKSRVRQLLGDYPVAQCQNGQCGSGWQSYGDGEVTYRPVQKPEPIVTQPTKTQDEIRNEWKQYISQQVSVAVEGKGCTCDHTQDVTRAEFQSLSTQVAALAESTVKLADNVKNIAQSNATINQTIGDMKPYVPPTPEQQAAAIEPFLKHSATITLLDGTTKQQTRPLSSPLQFTQHSVGLK